MVWWIVRASCREIRAWTSFRICACRSGIHAGRVGEIESSVRWALKQRGENNNPVLVHRAFGHGRSVTIMYVLLVTLGVCDTWQNAGTHIKRSRPLSRLNKGQKKSLIAWKSTYASKPEKKHS